MEPKEMSELLAELDASCEDFARHIGVRPETVSRWANGHAPIPRYAELILHYSKHAERLIAHIRADFTIPTGREMAQSSGKFDRKAYQRNYMREYMRKRRARLRNF
jgi:DNA-binding XRE family transcriptional regulator